MIQMVSAAPPSLPAIWHAPLVAAAAAGRSSAASAGGALLIDLIVPLLLVLLVLWLVRRHGIRHAGASGGAPGGLGALSRVGKARSKLYDATRPTTKFSDVAGYEAVKQEVSEVVDYLRRPDRYRRVGATGPKGVLMAGPPGTGKTLLARTLAGEANVPFLSVTASSFVEMFVGVGASRVRDLFSEARKRAPAIIFIDELDAVGQKRAGGGGPQMGDSEREQTLQQMLSEWMASSPAGAWWCWPPRTARRFWTRRCCGPAGSTGTCRSRGQMGAAGDPGGTRPRKTPRPRYRLRPDRRHDARLLRRRPRGPAERSSNQNGAR